MFNSITPLDEYEKSLSTVGRFFCVLNVVKSFSRLSLCYVEIIGTWTKEFPRLNSLAFVVVGDRFVGSRSGLLKITIEVCFLEMNNCCQMHTREEKNW